MTIANGSFRQSPQGAYQYRTTRDHRLSGFVAPSATPDGRLQWGGYRLQGLTCGSFSLYSSWEATIGPSDPAGGTQGSRNIPSAWLVSGAQWKVRLNPVSQSPAVYRVIVHIGAVFCDPGGTGNFLSVAGVEVLPDEPQPESWQPYPAGGGYDTLIAFTSTPQYFIGFRRDDNASLFGVQFVADVFLPA